MSNTILRVQYANNPGSVIDLDAHLDLDGDGNRDDDEAIEPLGGNNGGGFFFDAGDELLINPYTGTNDPDLVDITVKGRSGSGEFAGLNAPGQLRISNSGPAALVVDSGSNQAIGVGDEGPGNRDFNNGEIIRFDLQSDLLASAAEITFGYNFQDFQEGQDTDDVDVIIRFYNGDTEVDTSQFDLSQGLTINAISDQPFDAIEIQAASNDAVLSLVGVNFSIDSPPPLAPLSISTAFVEELDLIENLDFDVNGDGHIDSIVQPIPGEEFQQVISVTNPNSVAVADTRVTIDATSNLFETDLTTLVVKDSNGNSVPFIFVSDNGETAEIEISSIAAGDTVTIEYTTVVPQNAAITTKSLTFSTQGNGIPNDPPGDSFYDLTLYLNENNYSSPGNDEFIFGPFDEDLQTEAIDAYKPTATLVDDAVQAQASLLATTLYGFEFNQFPDVHGDSVHNLFSVEANRFIQDPIYQTTGTRRSDPTEFELQLVWQGSDDGQDTYTLAEALAILADGSFGVTNADDEITKDGQTFTGTLTITDPETGNIVNEQTAIAGNIFDMESHAVKLTFGQVPNKLKMEARQDGVLIERVDGQQNRPAPDAGPFNIFAVDSPDSNSKRKDLVDRTFFDQGEGIGIVDGDDSTPLARKRIEGDEILGISVTGFKADEALINVGRITSDDGAKIRVEAFVGDIMIDSEVFNLGSVPSRKVQTLEFTSLGAFDTLLISAADGDTQFTFRSVKLPNAFEA